MISILCYFIAGLFFFLAGINEKFIGQPELDEIAWGLFFVVLAWILAGLGPPVVWIKRQQ